MSILIRLVFAVVRHLFTSRANLLLENLALRQQLAMFERSRGRLEIADTDRAFWVALKDHLDHVVLSEQHLRRLGNAYISYYNADRCHTTLDGDSPDGRPVSPRPSRDAEVVALPRASRLHHRYEWRAAA